MPVIDTGVLIAAFNRRDSLHEAGWAIVQAADAGRIEPLIVHDFVLAETLNHLNRKVGSPAARDSLRRLEASDGFRLVRLSDVVYSIGKNDVFPHEAGLSFVDALTVAYMRENKIHTLYSFDEGFDGRVGIRRTKARPPHRGR
ncbi:MAG: PIN domain-containing protein [Euryarchaeota archaeon]|nr:PIN domain-containing protein [Euryarchaeota archaeon]